LGGFLGVCESALAAADLAALEAFELRVFPAFDAAFDPVCFGFFGLFAMPHSSFPEFDPGRSMWFYAGSPTSRTTRLPTDRAVSYDTARSFRCASKICKQTSHRHVMECDCKVAAFVVNAIPLVQLQPLVEPQPSQT